MQILSLPLVSSVTLDKYFACSVYMRHEGNISHFQGWHKNRSVST